MRCWTASATITNPYQPNPGHGHCLHPRIGVLSGGASANHLPTSALLVLKSNFDARELGWLRTRRSRVFESLRAHHRLGITGATVGYDHGEGIRVASGDGPAVRTSAVPRNTTHGD